VDGPFYRSGEGYLACLRGSRNQRIINLRGESQWKAAVINLTAIIGVYPICQYRRGGWCNQIDYNEDRVLASINGQGAEWCDLTEEYMETSGELELGFHLGGLFVPFCEVMRFYGGGQ
jgi:hypothetical protein